MDMYDASDKLFFKNLNERLIDSKKSNFLSSIISLMSNFNNGSIITKKILSEKIYISERKAQDVLSVIISTGMFYRTPVKSITGRDSYKYFVNTPLFVMTVFSFAFELVLNKEPTAEEEDFFLSLIINNFRYVSKTRASYTTVKLLHSYKKLNVLDEDKILQDFRTVRKTTSDLSQKEITECNRHFNFN